MLASMRSTKSYESLKKFAITFVNDMHSIGRDFDGIGIYRLFFGNFRGLCTLNDNALIAMKEIRGELLTTGNLAQRIRVVAIRTHNQPIF